MRKGWVCCGLLLFLSGCTWPQMSLPNSLAPLTVVEGQAMLPDAYQITADTQPVPRSYQLLLTKLDSTPLAAGAISDDQGDFTINVPQDLLTSRPSLYEIHLLDQRQNPVLQGLVKLSAQTSQTTAQLNSASTALTLAANAYRLDGKDPSSWDITSLLDNTQLESAALSYSYQLATWSNETAGATGSPQPPAPSNEVVQKVLGIATSS